MVSIVPSYCVTVLRCPILACTRGCPSGCGMIERWQTFKMIAYARTHFGVVIWVVRSSEHACPVFNSRSIIRASSWYFCTILEISFALQYDLQEHAVLEGTCIVS